MSRESCPSCHRPLLAAHARRCEQCGVRACPSCVEYQVDLGYLCPTHYEQATEYQTTFANPAPDTESEW